MGAGVYSPQEAGEGPSIFGVAKAIGSKIRDAAQEAKEEREKADKEGVQVKKGSLFKSALGNKFNPIKSKKSKANWNKQFSWNQKKADKPSSVNGQPTGGGGSGQRSGGEKLKNFIAGGFSAILKDTTQMVSKLNNLNTLSNDNVAAAQRSSDTLTIIKETLTTQTDLRRKAVESAKFAQSEKQLERTKDTAGLFSNKKTDGGGDKKSDEPGGGPDWLNWLLGPLQALDFIPDKWFQKLNPFKKPKVTTGGTPSGPRMPGTRPRVTTSGGATAPKVPGVKPSTPRVGGRAGGGLLGAVALPLAQLFEPQILDGISGLHDGLGVGLGKLSDDEIKKKYEEEKKRVESIESGPFGGLFGNLFVPEMRDFSELPMLTREMEKRKLSLSEGGIVDNPTETNLYPGDQVIPLDSKVGRELTGDAQDAQTNKDLMAIPFKTVGASILGISNRMLKATDTGIAGDMVRQDIAKLSRDFGIANVLTTTSLGKAQFGTSNTEEKSKNFLQKLLEKVGFNFGDSGDSGAGNGGGNNNPTPPDIENTQVKNEVDLGANTHPDVGFTPGQQFGARQGAHRGSDIGTGGQKGYYVALKKSGTVVNNSSDATSGNWVGIDVGNGTEYRFMHLAQKSPLKVGDPYNGQTIGEIGNTGRSSGEHLHFEKLVNGTHVDPKDDAKSLLSIGKELQVNFSPPNTRQPPAQRPSSNARGGNVAAIAMGTNDLGVDSSIPQRNTQRIVKYVKEKGYNPVVIPPFNEGKFKKPREGVLRGARLAGAPVVNMSGKPVDQYGHNSKSDRQRLGRMFKESLLVGDSNAVGIKYFSPKSRLIGGVGKDTDSIWLDVKNSGLKSIVPPKKNPSTPSPSPSGGRSPAPARPAQPATPSRTPPRTPQAAATVPSTPQVNLGQGGASQSGELNSIVVQAPAQQKINTAGTSGTFGSPVQAGYTSSVTFSDFLYEDLV